MGFKKVSLEALEIATKAAADIGATVDLGTDTLLVRVAKSKLSPLWVLALFGCGVGVGTVFGGTLVALF